MKEDIFRRSHVFFCIVAVGFPRHVGLPDDILYIVLLFFMNLFPDYIILLDYQVKHVLNIYIYWYLLFFSSLCRTGSQFLPSPPSARCAREVFVIEVVVKLLLLSPRVYFTGTNYAWNIGAPPSWLVVTPPSGAFPNWGTSQIIQVIRPFLVLPSWSSKSLCQWMSMVERKHIKYIKSNPWFLWAEPVAEPFLLYWPLHGPKSCRGPLIQPHGICIVIWNPKKMQIQDVGY